MSDELHFDYILEAFQYLDDWESRYQFIEDLGTKLPPMDAGDKTTDTQVHGCMSMVWLKAFAGADGAVEFRGDSDTSTIKGIVAILVAIYAGKTADEIVNTDTDQKFDELKLFDHLSPTRHVGVYAMVEHAKKEAGRLL